MSQQTTIAVDGTDAFEFLQGQLSNDLRLLEKLPSIPAAWCNPKGRVIWFGDVVATATGYAMAAPSETAAEIVKRLTIFRFRSKVDFSLSDSGNGHDPSRQIKQGIPTIGREQSELYTPHMLNLDLLDAISLDKGCYTGQEIVARTHYKGATKRRTLRFASERRVGVGDKISNADRDIGAVLNVADQEFLAVVSVAKCTGELNVAGQAVERRPIDYMNETQ